MRQFLRTTLAITLLAANPAWSACQVPDPTEAAAAWTAQQKDYSWTARNNAYPGLNVELFMQSPGTPRVLDWAIPERYQNRIGLLQYYAGEPGTSVLVKLVTTAVIDLKSGAEIGAATFTANCEVVSWRWFDDRIEIDDPGYGLIVIELP